MCRAIQIFVAAVAAKLAANNVTYTYTHIHIHKHIRILAMSSVLSCNFFVACIILLPTFVAYGP